MTPRRRLYVVEERDEKALEWRLPPGDCTYCHSRYEGRCQLRWRRKYRVAARNESPRRARFMTRLAVYVCSGRAR